MIHDLYYPLLLGVLVFCQFSINKTVATPGYYVHVICTPYISLLYSKTRVLRGKHFYYDIIEPPHGKTNNLPMRKQRHRSASR